MSEFNTKKGEERRKCLQQAMPLLFFFAIYPASLFGQAVPESSGNSGTAEGVVVVVGSAINAQTRLKNPKDSAEGTSLCRSAIARRVGRVTGMTVSASGSWSQNPVSKDKCLEVKSFRILKTSSGREAVVGKLVKQDANFFVETQNGKRQSLSSVPAGLSKLEGKEVIIDVKPLDSPGTPGAAENSWKVVSYSEHP